MKKILLIIILAMCIFQMVVLATAIDIGSAAIDRAYALSSGMKIDNNNSANATGTITEVKIWCNTELAGCEVGTFYLISGTTYSSRDYETVNNGNGSGVVLAGSEQTFTVSLDVEAGDLLGMRYTAGKMEEDASGVGESYVYTTFPVSSVEFSFTANRTISLYGTGATAGIKWNGVIISKWNGETISKWNNM